MKVYIVAGNKHEFQAYVLRKAAENSTDHYVYVDCLLRLRGLDEVNGFYIGTYEQREDIEEIREQIAIIKYKNKSESI